MSYTARQPRLAGPLGLSAVLHAAVVLLAMLAFRDAPPPTLPPVYRVNIVAAPAGTRAIGEVQPRPAPAATTPAPPSREVAPRELAPPTAKPRQAPASPRATPTPARARPAASTPAPRAGGGPVGGKGADVATVRTEGVDFPFPAYLNNIVRQIALNFRPSNSSAALRADVMFLIRRDGSVSNVRFVTRSGVYAFDLEAQGAVEAAASARAFGPLPAGFPDDVLPVVFSFDPKFLR